MQRSIKPNTLLWILTGINLFNYIDRFILSSVLESIKSEFALSDAQTGFLSTAFMLGYFISSPFFGFLGDRWPRKWLMAAGIFVWSAATLLSGFSQTFWQLIACRIFVGFGEASYATLSPSLISDVFPPAKRNNALTIFYVAIPLGAALGTLFGSAVGARYGWHWAFIWAGLPGLFLAFVLLPFREPGRGEADGHSQYTVPTLKDFFALFKIKQFNLVCWGYVAYTFALGAYQHWGQAFLQRERGLSQEAAGSFFGATLVISGLVGTFAGGFWATKWRKTNAGAYAWVSGLTVLLAVPAVTLISFVSSAPLTLMLFAPAILLLFFSTGPVNTMIVESVPINLRASSTALSIFLIHAFGDLWSPWLVGTISDQVQSLSKALLLLPGALFIAAVLWLSLAKHQMFIARKTNP